MSTDYSLGWILPYVRESLRERSEFDSLNYLDAVWRRLEAANVQGVVKYDSQYQASNFGTWYDFSQAPHQLRIAARDAFFYLIHNGFALPGILTNSGVFGDPRKYYVTAKGTAWAAGCEPLPEDFDGYMKLLRSLVSNLDSVIEQYVSEGLGAFIRGSYFAAAVMVGAAAEKAVYLLAESIVNALKNPAEQATLKKLLSDRKLLALFKFVEQSLNAAAKIVPYSIVEGSASHLVSLIEAIRVQRNDAVHPMNAQVSAESVRHSFGAFPHTLQKMEALRAWFLTNPKSI